MKIILPSEKVRIAAEKAIEDIKAGRQAKWESAIKLQMKKRKSLFWGDFYSREEAEKYLRTNHSDWLSTFEEIHSLWSRQYTNASRLRDASYHSAKIELNESDFDDLRDYLNGD